MIEKAKRVVATGRPEVCPICGANTVARKQYGLTFVNDQLAEEIELGLVVLGGCIVTGDDPDWQCTSCGAQIYRGKQDPGSGE